MNALKQFAFMGTPVFEEQIYYKDTASVLICGEILPYEVFRLFTGTEEVKKLYIFPYPFQEGWERPLYFSFDPTGAALEEMGKYVEKKWEEMRQTIREHPPGIPVCHPAIKRKKSRDLDTIIPKVEKWEG